MIIQERKNFKYGQIDELEDRSIPVGAASHSLNWLTEGDKIELRRGFRFIGEDPEEALGKVRGGIKVVKADNSQQIFFATGAKVKYLDVATNTILECGTDILGATNNLTEFVDFQIYVTNAGYQLWISSPNTVLLKIMIANPGSYSDMYDAAKNYKGYFEIKTNRMFLWQPLNDSTGLYLSYVDSQDYTTVTAESVGTGNGILTTFTDTLVFKAGGSKRTCFGITVTDGVETFRDNFNGGLVGSAGGTGTINYTTGAISVTFNTAPLNLAAITCNYQWEDSTDGGIADFTSSATRLAGEGLILRQDEGGGRFQALLFLGDIAFCFHEFKTWKLTIGADDTTASNQIHRESLGIPSRNAAWIVNEGIMVVDASDKNNPQLRLMEYASETDQVIDRAVSSNIILSGYDFSECYGQRYDDLSLVACKTVGSDVNDRVLLYNHTWQSFDWLDYFVSVFFVYNGILHAGDSASNNIQELFSGFDDDEALIGNEWIGHLDPLEAPARMKKCKMFRIVGDIGPDGEIRVYTSRDNGPFAELTDLAGNAAIRGDGTYIDRTNSINVGSNTVGSSEVGGGGDGAVAYHYERLLKLRVDKFENIKLKFVATGLGYHSITEYNWWDVRMKHQRNPQKYRVY